MSPLLCGLYLVLVTISLSVVLAWRFRQLPYFPIQISKTANRDPSLSVFRAGLTIASLGCFLPFFLVRSLPLGVIGSLVLPFVGWISDASAPRLHASIASVTFALFSLQGFVISPISLLGGCSQLLNALLFLPLAHEYAHLCPSALEFMCPVADALALREVHWNLWVKRTRGILQWITIGCIGYNLAHVQ